MTTGLLQKSTMKNNGSLFGSLELIQNTTKLTQTTFKRLEIMDIKPIKNESDYQEALERLNQVFDAKPGSPESDEADILAVLIDQYENRNYPIDGPDPIEAIKIRMEELQLKQVDIVKEFGGKSRVSEMLNRKRKLTLEMIRYLANKLNLSAGLLIQDYHLMK